MLTLPSFNRRVANCAVALLATTLIATAAQAQIIRDATPGQTPGALTPIDGVIELHGADGIRRGANNEIVLHSLDQFNLNAGETVRYTDAADLINDIANVLTRVTGGSPSLLDGHLESLYPQADLFFVNPNGVFFGANFTIDVPQSFHTSTADRLEWDPGVEIDLTSPTEVPLLTAAVPGAWRFLGAGPEKRIEIAGFKLVDRVDSAETATFSFVGSDLRLGTTNAPIQFNFRDRDVSLIAVGDTVTIEGAIISGNEVIDFSDVSLTTGTTTTEGVVPFPSISTTTQILVSETGGVLSGG
ncbi:MAG: filamentous hemagglutinin N-terminal domain-containing protein, partial [Myxococcota bacterium]